MIINRFKIYNKKALSQGQSFFIYHTLNNVGRTYFNNSMTIVGAKERTIITIQCPNESAVKPNNVCVNGINVITKVITVAKIAMLTNEGFAR